LSEAPSSNIAEPGQLRHLTVCFIDLVGSTALSAELDLEDYKDLIRSYHITCTRVIGSHGGSVAQYAGDGVMAYFGYPRAQEDDPERAALAALKEVSEIKTNWGGKLTARVGIATGQVLIDGLAYEGVEMIRSAMGEIPNLAARLQSLAEPGTVVVSEPTRRLLGNQFICEDAGRHELKGFRGLTVRSAPARRQVPFREPPGRSHAAPAALGTGRQGPGQHGAALRRARDRKVPAGAGTRGPCSRAQACAPAVSVLRASHQQRTLPGDGTF
jgi:class 3 adenylate cyclase